MTEQNAPSVGDGVAHMSKTRVQHHYTHFLGCGHILLMLAKVSRSDRDVVTRHPCYCPLCGAEKRKHNVKIS
jgi:hypothetical protein